MRNTTLATVVVMSATLGSRVLGFIRQAVINAVFGASGEADVLNLVFNIPNNLRKLLAEGALSSAFIPVLSASVVRDESGAEARGVVRRVLAFQFVVLIPILLGSVLFAPQVVGFILDFPEPSRQALAADLFRWLINYLLLISVSAVLMGTIHAHQQFLVPAVTPLLFSISVIASVLLLQRRLGVHAMAVGVLIGGFAQIIFQIPAYRRLGCRFRLSLGFADPLFRKILRQWLPVVATASIFTVNTQVAMFFASGLEDGSGSALTNALTFWQLPFGIFSASITTVLFPRMSRQAASNDTEGLRTTLRYGVRYLIALLVPSALVMALLGEQIIAVAFQRGAFALENTIMAARVLRGFCVGLLSVGAYNFFQRFFYSVGDFRTPMVIAGVTFVLDVALSLWLKETVLAVAGLSLANSIAFTIGLGLMVMRARAHVGGLGVREILVTLAKTSVAAGVLVVMSIVFERWSGNDWWQIGSSALGFGYLIAMCLAMVFVVVGLYIVMKVDVVAILLRRKRP